MTHDTMYYFEHIALPYLFAENKQTFLSVALKNPAFFNGMLTSICDEKEEENPYSDGDFKAEPITLAKNILILSITFPKPKETPLCYKQYIFFDREFKNTQYFCIEKAMDDEEDKMPYVCSWEGENHLNYGRVSMEKELADLVRCAEIFSKNAFQREFKDILKEELEEDNP